MVLKRRGLKELITAIARRVNTARVWLERGRARCYPWAMIKELQVEVGMRIRDRRKAIGLSQEDFAREAGLARSFFGRVERGSQNISLDTLARIAVALRADLGELLAGLPDRTKAGGEETKSRT
jgi:DNA-binding XRE family transcriptional regulator